tara:strand:- start:118 stop:411 length:294 start_codon:yes stop_codon:yes gene_type:complete
MSTIDQIVVNTDEERKQWIQLLKAASDYHYDMSAQFEPEDPDDDTEEMEVVAKIHRAWGRAIQDASEIINMWSIEEEEIVIATPTPKPPIDITPTKE